MDERETLRLNIDIRDIPRDARREVFLREDCSWMIAKSRSGNRHGYLSVVLFHEEYFYAGRRRRILNFQKDEGERIALCKSVQRDTGKISTLDKFPSFFNLSLLPAYLPACPSREVKKDKKHKKHYSLCGLWACWIPATCVRFTRELILIR